jgi:hypothetical protein
MTTVALPPVTATRDGMRRGVMWIVVAMTIVAAMIGAATMRTGAVSIAGPLTIVGAGIRSVADSCG